MVDVQKAWDNVIKYEGEVFKTVSGREFTYVMVDENNSFVTDRGKIALTKRNFEKAYKMMPAMGPSVLNKNGIMGHAYIFALLNDLRIVG